MSYHMRRVIIFTHNFAAMRDFYRDMFGLSVVEEDEGWADLSAGGCNIAIHAAGPHVTVGPDYEGPHKIVFHADDVGAAESSEARYEIVEFDPGSDIIEIFCRPYDAVQRCPDLVAHPAADGVDRAAERLLLGNGVKVDGIVVNDPRATWTHSAPATLSVGSRRFVRVVPNE